MSYFCWWEELNTKGWVLQRWVSYVCNTPRVQHLNRWGKSGVCWMPVRGTQRWETWKEVPPPSDLSTPSVTVHWHLPPTTDLGSSRCFPPPASSPSLGSTSPGEAGVREVEGAGPVLCNEAPGDAVGRQREGRGIPAAARLRCCHQKMSCQLQFCAERDWHRNRKQYSVLRGVATHLSGVLVGRQGYSAAQEKYTAQFTSSRDRLMAKWAIPMDTSKYTTSLTTWIIEPKSALSAALKKDY